MKLITQNPYRILGVLSNSPLKDRVSNQNRLTAFANVGKEVSFPSDFIEVISEKPIRTRESIETAVNGLNLDRDQLKHALFWFIKVTPRDEEALGFLKEGDTRKALEIWKSARDFSAMVNAGVLYFILDDPSMGFPLISEVLRNEDLRRDLLAALDLSALSIDGEELSEMFTSEVLTEVPSESLLYSDMDSREKELIGKNAREELFQLINSEVAVAKNVDAKDSQANLEAGTRLMENTREALAQLMEIVGEDSDEYQMMADRVAKYVLRCSINYYNAADDKDTESPLKAMVLQEYAGSIARGQIMRERCQENLEILQKAVDVMAPAEVREEDAQIKEELRIFRQLPPQITYAQQLLDSTKWTLDVIREKIGVNHPYFIAISTQVVAGALNYVIDDLNELLKEIENTSFISPDIISNKVRPRISAAIEATGKMDDFYMEEEFMNVRYIPNRDKIYDLWDRFSETRVAPARGKDSDNNGCSGGTIAVIGFIIYLLLRACT